MQPFPCRRQAGTCISQQAGSAHSSCSLVSLCCRGSFPAGVVSQCPQRFLSSPGVLLIHVSVAPSCCAHMGRDGSGCWGGRALQGSAAQEQFCGSCGVFGWSHSVTTCWPCHQLSVSCCTPAFPVTMEPPAHDIPTVTLGIYLPSNATACFEFFIFPQFCIFREKALSVVCCSQTAALVTSPPVGP